MKNLDVEKLFRTVVCAGRNLKIEFKHHKKDSRLRGNDESSSSPERQSLNLPEL